MVAEAEAAMQRASGEALDVVIGRNLRAHREAHGWTRTKVAQGMGAAGLDWNHQTVGMTERAERPLTVAEMLVLPVAIGMQPADLFAGDGVVRIGRLRVLDRGQLRQVVTGQPIDRLRWKAALDEIAEDDGVDPEELMAEALRWWPDCAHVGKAMDAYRESVGEVEPKVGRALTKRFGKPVSGFTVALIAHRLWGHSLTAERDTRVGDRIGGSPDITARSLQSHRGHVTRQLVADVAAIVESEG